jgi:glycosyltransferase involved in cell wall biosynthesis
MATSVSVAVITLNEEDRLAACLASVAWAGEIVVVDSGSTDRTVEVARRFTDRVLVRSFAGYGAQKNVAAEACRGDWVLSLDADERVPVALGEEIRAVAAADPREAGFLVARRNLFLGRWMRHGGLYPDYQLRLFRRGRARFREVAVHESARVEGPVGRLREAILHDSYRGLADFVARHNRYSDLAAGELAAAGRGGGLADLVLRPSWRFLAMYLLRGGFLDGWRGLVLAGLYAHYVFLRAAKVRERALTRRAA